ncbi:MAG: hypothetical protein A2V70_18060 [Planctomycetes bacterium RBG_13_63_9]|nr:MAG: hypothetical protein A2V70_18060 [Planctomycetes bacterium RBG_13_63_9]
MSMSDCRRVQRREFLSRVARGAGMVGVPGLLGSGDAAGAEGRWKMRLSTSTIHFGRLPIEEAFRRIAALGFEAVDIWSAFGGCPHLDDALDRLGPEGLKELLAKHALELYAFSVYVGGYAKYAELLGKAGGGVAIRGSAGPCERKDLSTRMKAFLESLQGEVELAQKHNSYLAIENHGDALLDSLDSLKAFVELNRHPRLGIALAPYHLQAGGIPVEEAIAVCGKQLFFFYAWQHAAGQEQLPGIGPTDCGPWIAALRKVDYRWYVNPFMHNEPEPEAMSKGLARARDYLKQCYARVTSG